MHIRKTCEQLKVLKHINMEYHFLQRKIRVGTVSINKISSAKQIVDLFTNGKYHLRNSEKKVFG